MIRRAEPADSIAVAAMGKRFAEAAGTGLPFSAAYAEASARSLMADPAGVILLWQTGPAPSGVLAARLSQHMLFPVVWAVEHLWWVDPPARGRAARPMLRALEAWARERGADGVALSSLDERTGEMMRRMGYETTPERHHLLRLCA